MKRFRFAILMMAVITARPVLAGVEEEIREAEKKWAAAVVARDAATLEKVLTPSLIYAHSTGVIETKQQYLDRLKSGAQRYEGVDHEKIQVVPYGDSAVAHCIMRMRGTSDRRPFNDHIMMMHLWVKQGGAWRLAAHQTTKIP